MLGFIDENTKKAHFVIGNFYVVDHDEKKSGHAFIIKNIHTYNFYANQSAEHKATLDRLDALKNEKPFEWGVYEDWERAVNLNLAAITEAVARQYQALDYIIGTGRDTGGTAIYMLRRIESSYKTFLQYKRVNGDVAAHNYLETVRKQGLTERRMSIYYERLLKRIKSDVPLCTGFFQDDNIDSYIRQLTQSQGFMKKPRIEAEKLTFEDILTEYLQTNEADDEALGLNDSVPAITA